MQGAVCADAEEVTLLAAGLGFLAGFRGGGISALVETDTAMGSFDYVRLAPHFAQDDSGFKGSLTRCFRLANS
jgi:hypothetical protein